MVEKKHSFAESRVVTESRYLRRRGQMSGIRRPTASRAFPLICRSLALLMAVTATIGMTTRPCVAQIDAAAVQRSIDRGIAYLRKVQNGRGGWEEHGGQSCGLSALCTLALLNAGVSRDDPDLIRAMRYLRTFEPRETYSISLQTLVFCQLGAAGDLPRIRRNVDRLIATQVRGGGHRIAGSWNYGSVGAGDPSNSQFALLALGAAVDRGIEIDREVFDQALKYWLSRQQGGGWAYGLGRGTSGSMTCAGIASIIIARDRLGSAASSVSDGQIQCCGGDVEGEDPVEQGLQWLARNFSLEVNPGGDKFTFYYYMYALERVGRLSGRRYIGEGHDWYRQGAERLLNLQDDFQGFWPSSGPMENRDVATAFALLFLSKGKRQVVVGQMKYDDRRLPGQWKAHPDALRQLVRHVERDWGRDLTWQTIDGVTASLKDLLQAPVLIISGRGPLRFDEQLSERLRRYVDQGGTILFEANAGDGCGDASGFEASVGRLCQSWFPGTSLERLPPSHPIWFAEHRATPAPLGKDFWMYGVQACCRTAVFYTPKSLSCRWQLGGALFHRDRLDDTEGGQAVGRQIDQSIRIGQNLIAYATGRELKDKLDQRLILEGTPPPDASRNAIRIATLALDAGGQEARRAVPNVAALIAARIPVQLTASPRPIGFNRDQLRDIPFLWVHGRTEFKFSEAERKTLREYVENGGVILGSAVCGSQPFADAFRREMGAVLPESPLRTMPPDHPALQAYGGFDIRSVEIRTPGDAGGGVGRRFSPPILELASVDNLVGVVFSPLDLSCALESPNSVQCPGYSTDDAAKIVANLVMYALQQ